MFYFNEAPSPSIVQDFSLSSASIVRLVGDRLRTEMTALSYEEHQALSNHPDPVSNHLDPLLNHLAMVVTG